MTGHSNSTCTFETEDIPVQCGWYERGSARYKWVLRKGRTPSYYTGPGRDHTTASGKFNVQTYHHEKSENCQDRKLLLFSLHLSLRKKWYYI